MNDDERRILLDCEQELKQIKTWIDLKENKFHTNIRYLVAYAVVKSTGSIEVVFKSMINNFLSQSCIPETRTYLEKNIIDSSANPSTGVIERFLEQFDPIRKERFIDLLKNSQDKGNLKNLVNLRNDFAHGQKINSSIMEVEKYFLSGVAVLNVLSQVLYENS